MLGRLQTTVEETETPLPAQRGRSRGYLEHMLVALGDKREYDY